MTRNKNQDYHEMLNIHKELMNLMKLSLKSFVKMQIKVWKGSYPKGSAVSMTNVALTKGCTVKSSF